MAFTSSPMLWAFNGSTGKRLSGHQSPGGPSLRGCRHWLLGMPLEPEPVLTQKLQGQWGPPPAYTRAYLASLQEVTGMLRGKSALPTLLSKLGARVGSARQPPLPPALPAPSLAGRRQLCGCSAHLPPPESRALKLPGCGQPCCHGNCILHPCRRLHLKATGENR